MKILPCSLVIHLQAEQHAEIKGKTIEDILRFKYQKMEELKAEIEDLEEQKTQEDLGEQEFPANPEVLQGDYDSDYADKFPEHGDNLKIREQDDEEATVTVGEESVDTDNIETKKDKAGCKAPKADQCWPDSSQCPVPPVLTQPTFQQPPPQYRSDRSLTGLDRPLVPL